MGSGVRGLGLSCDTMVWCGVCVKVRVESRLGVLRKEGPWGGEPAVVTVTVPVPVTVPVAVWQVPRHNDHNNSFTG